MTDLRKAAEMAIPLLVAYQDYTDDSRIANKCGKAIEALRQALAQPEHNHLSDAMRLYQAVDRLATQAGEDASETIDWLCGEHGGMSKLFEAYFSPKPLANQTVDSGSPIDSSTNIAGSSIDSSDSSTHSADSAETFGKTEQEPVERKTLIECIAGAISNHMTVGLYPKELFSAAEYIADNYTAPQNPDVTLTDEGKTDKPCQCFKPDACNLHDRCMKAPP